MKYLINILRIINSYKVKTKAGSVVVNGLISNFVVEDSPTKKIRDIIDYV